MRLKNEENETKNSIYSFISLDGPAGCYFATKLQGNKSFFAKDLFVLALNKCFVTPDRLYSSMASSENKSAFKKKRLKKERKVNIYKL